MQVRERGGGGGVCGGDVEEREVRKEGKEEKGRRGKQKISCKTEGPSAAHLNSPFSILTATPASFLCSTAKGSVV